MWPSGDLRTVIVRPTFDESPAGVITRDSRTTLAILDPERATWVLGARLTEQEGLDLTRRLQQLMIEHSLLEQRQRASGLVVELRLQPEDGGSLLPVQGGKWHVLTKNLDSNEATIRLGVVDGQSGKLVGEAAMDLVIARDLMHRLAAAIRSPPTDSQFDLLPLGTLTHRDQRRSSSVFPRILDCRFAVASIPRRHGGGVATARSAWW